jgi:predicted DNA-binding protein (UPF0251 family)
MMNVTSRTQLVVNIALTENEAIRLKDMLQNPFKHEVDINRQLREALFDALIEALRE